MAPFNRQDGFTLLEMVIAMGLFATGLLGLCLMASGFMGSNGAARNRADATQLARNKLEALSQDPYSEIVDSLEENIDSSGDSGTGVFQRKVAVEEKESPACKVVTVTVKWQSKGAHRVVLKTVFAP